MNATLYQLSYFAYSTLDCPRRRSGVTPKGDSEGRYVRLVGAQAIQVVWLHIWIVRFVVWKAREDQIFHEPLYTSLQEHLWLFLLEREPQNAFVDCVLLLEDNT